MGTYISVKAKGTNQRSLSNNKEFSVVGLLRHKLYLVQYLFALNLLAETWIRIPTAEPKSETRSENTLEECLKACDHPTHKSTNSQTKHKHSSQMTKSSVVCWSINHTLCCIYWRSSYWQRGRSEYTCKDWSSHCNRILDQKPHYIQQSQDKFGNPKPLFIVAHSLSSSPTVTYSSLFLRF